LASTQPWCSRTVLDELTRGLVEEDEEIQAVADRPYWEAQGTKATLGMADELLQVVHAFAPGFEFK